MKSRFLAACAAAAFSVLTMSAASAATVTYQNADLTPQMQLTIDDSGAGTFRFTLTTLVGTADFLGLGFNIPGMANILTSASFALVSATNASNVAITPALVLFGNNSGVQTSCGSGCNFNGSGHASSFDYILRIGSNGGNPINFVKTVVFDLTFAGSLSDNPFSQLGVRAQSTTGTSTSIKADLIQQPPQVPLPAAGLMLLAALGGLAALRRRN